MFDKISEFNINNQKIPQLCFKILCLEKRSCVLLIIHV